MNRVQRKVSRLSNNKFYLQLELADKKYPHLFTEDDKYINVDYKHEDYHNWMKELRKISYNKIRKETRKELKKAGI